MINVALVDDHPLFRIGLKSIINATPNMDVVQEFNNGEEFIQGLDTQIDLALLDLDMPKMNGMLTMEALRKSGSDLKVMFVSQNREPLLISGLMELGARGYLHKEEGEETIRNALLSVVQNGYYFNDLVSKSMLAKLANKDSINPHYKTIEPLSKREKEVLQLICQEMTTPEIGEKLFISSKTVANHRTRMMEKIGAKNLAGLVVFAIKNKIYEPQET